MSLLKPAAGGGVWHGTASRPSRDQRVDEQVTPLAAPPAAPQVRSGMDATYVDRKRFREYPLDGAMLYFQPANGVHVRVEVPATAAQRRRAPRVAMFGITNACNLACSFCSRDVARPSAWTVDTAAAVLRDLDAAGTLEVAYGAVSRSRSAGSPSWSPR